MTRERPDPDRTDERLRAALEAHPEVLFAYRFGSSVRGGEHPLSDVDVAVPELMVQYRWIDLADAGPGGEASQDGPVVTGVLRF